MSLSVGLQNMGAEFYRRSLKEWFSSVWKFDLKTLSRYSFFMRGLIFRLPYLGDFAFLSRHQLADSEETCTLSYNRYTSNYDGPAGQNKGWRLPQFTIKENILVIVVLVAWHSEWPLKNLGRFRKFLPKAVLPNTQHWRLRWENQQWHQTAGFREIWLQILKQRWQVKSPT